VRNKPAVGIEKERAAQHEGKAQNKEGGGSDRVRWEKIQGEKRKGVDRLLRDPKELTQKQENERRELIGAKKRKLLLQAYSLTKSYPSGDTRDLRRTSIGIGKENDM